jgi:hypothetical protein
MIAYGELAKYARLDDWMICLQQAGVNEEETEKICEYNDARKFL